MKRPILVAVIGYIIGIIMGLYFKFSIALLYFIITLIIAFIEFYKIIKFKIINNSKENIYKIFKKKKYKRLKKKKFSFYSISRYFRYLRLIINKKIIFIILIFSFLSNTIIILKNKQYESFYKIKSNVDIIAKVVSSPQEKEYKNTYKIQVIEINKNKKDVFLFLNVDKKQKLQYGDFIRIKGRYQVPSGQRNYGGFSYKDYLKTINIYGNVTADSIEILKKTKETNIEVIINKIKDNVKQNAKKYLDEETYSIYLGLILGDTSYIEDETKEAFRNSNLNHILAVSGMHITYIVIGIVIFFSKVSGKKIAKMICIILLVLYIILTGFSPSIIRACSTAIIMLIGGLINRKADIWTSLAISVFIILVYNPFLIINIGFQFSYMGTIGIILLSKNIMQILTYKRYKNSYKMSKYEILKRIIKEHIIIKTIVNTQNLIKSKIIKDNQYKEKQSKIKKIIAVSISVQIFIIPITLFHFNTFGIYFLITNLLLSLILGPVIILGFVFLLMLIFNFPIVNVLVFPMKMGIKAILFITNIGNLPFSKIYVRTPYIAEILMYYSFILILNYLLKIKLNKNPSNSDLRIHYMIQLFKYNFRKYKKKILTIVLIIVFLVSAFEFFIPKSLKIHFLDVGQGDCCFIETPENKTILIDGGGSEFGNFDVGESTLVPYILDRGFTKIDYIFISHFDSDHVKGLLTVLKELDVKNVIITTQIEICENYKDFIDIVKKKNINVKQVKKGDRILIEKDIYFDILWPNNQNLITENGLNNNSMVCKLNYNRISILFTGDIEEIAENQIINEYKNNIKKLKSTILKVAHHGSKTSTIQEFLNKVNPQIALIGVGENNRFGHPNNEVISRLENFRDKNI